MTTIHEATYGDHNSFGRRRCPSCGRRIRPFYIDGTPLHEHLCPWCDYPLGFRYRKKLL